MKRVIFVGTFLLFVAGCTARRGEPLRGPLTLNTERDHRGERAFYRYCNNCHPGGEAGLGPALNDKLAPPIAIKAQVRAGIGAMPAIPPDRLSEDELDALVDYMLKVRNHGPILQVD